MRNYSNVDRYLNELIQDIYPQPEDAGHTLLATKIIDRWMSGLPDCHNVLDVGAGTGFCQSMFERWKIEYTGVALGEDVIEAERLGRNVKRMDFSFLDFDDTSFDLVFSRHSLEHSFSPIISLMEWHRVSKSWLGLVVPAPEHFGYGGRNHNYVFNKAQWMNILDKTGWKPIWDTTHYLDPLASELVPMEYCLFCEKVKRKI